MTFWPRASRVGGEASAKGPLSRPGPAQVSRWGVGCAVRGGWERSGGGRPPGPRAPERAVAGSFLGCPFGGAEMGLNFLPPHPPARADARTPSRKIVARTQSTSTNHQPSWERPQMRAERQLIVWGRLKLQRGIVCAGDKSWCCHSDAELNPSLFLKGLICAEWAAIPQRERTCWEWPSWAPSRQEPSGEGNRM